MGLRGYETSPDAVPVTTPVMPTVTGGLTSRVRASISARLPVPANARVPIPVHRPRARRVPGSSSLVHCSSSPTPRPSGRIAHHSAFSAFPRSQSLTPFLLSLTLPAGILLSPNVAMIPTPVQAEVEAEAKVKAKARFKTGQGASLLASTSACSPASTFPVSISTLGVRASFPRAD